MKHVGWAGALVIAGCGGGTPTQGDAAVHDAAAPDGPGSSIGADLTPSIADFGVVVIGVASGPTTFTITNLGDTALGIPTIGIDGTNATAFAVDSTTCTAALAAGATCTIPVRFAPLAGGPVTANLTYTTAPNIALTARLDGTGASGNATLAVSPTTIGFATTTTGQTSSTTTVTVTNNSPASSGAITLAKGGADPTQFGIVANTCTSLPSNTSCMFGVDFAPTAAGAKTASISILYGTVGNVSVSVFGTAQ